MDNWISAKGPNSDIIISSRIRLARNLDNVPFPPAMTDRQAQEVIKSVMNALPMDRGPTDGFRMIQLDSMSETERQVLVEEYMASPDLIKNHRRSALLINKEQTASIMINEEDHVRIQCLVSGLQLREAWGLADKVDDLLEERLSYAYDEKLGYLTACPTNVGTGMRASVMMHLPALALTNNVNDILQAVSRVGMTVRGLYGEGSEAKGDIYQISNRISLGQAEEDIISNLVAVAKQVLDKERQGRELLMKNNRFQLEDKIYRSLGLFSNARMLTSQEAMGLLSDIRLGVSLELIKDIDLSLLNQLLFMIQPAHVQQSKGRELPPIERDIIRAELIREKLRR